MRILLAKIVLTPSKTWEDKAAYEAKATELAAKFRENIQKFNVSKEIVEQGGPIA